MKERQRLDVLKLQSMEERFQKRSKKGKGQQRSGTVSRGSYEERLLQAGILMPPRIYVGLCIAGGLAAACVASMLGSVLAIIAFAALTQHLLFGLVAEKAAKRRTEVIPQLAAFIDGLAAGLGTGFNTEGAIIQATQGVPPGVLREELDRVVSALNRGFSVREAMDVLKSRIEGREVTSLAVSVTLFANMGGRLLEPFRRLAKKIREQQVVVERAGRDLVQVRQAFLIILILSVGTPAFLAIVTPSYLANTLDDTMGRLILQISVGAQIGSVLLFKRMTNLKM